MLTKFTIDPNGSVTLSHDIEDVDGVRRVVRVFSCPKKGEPVVEHLSNGVKRVCKMIFYKSSTLSCSKPANLIDMIRCEYRAVHRIWRKANADKGVSNIWGSFAQNLNSFTQPTKSTHHIGANL